MTEDTVAGVLDSAWSDIQWINDIISFENSVVKLAKEFIFDQCIFGVNSSTCSNFMTLEIGY